jgi:2OG-Fe(II) oxygenase superfamily
MLKVATDVERNNMVTNADLIEAVEQNLQKTTVCAQPFPYAYTSQFFDHATAASVLYWLAHQAEWKLEASGFYIQHGWSPNSALAPGSPIDHISCAELKARMLHHMERLFGREFARDRIEICAHRMLTGHRIGIHTDCPRDGTETHRLVVHLCERYHEGQGGELALLDRDDPEGSLRVLLPHHNSAVLMEFSARSWHTVEAVTEGIRYSLLYSFWVKSPEVTVTAGEYPQLAVDTEQEGEFMTLIELLKTMDMSKLPHSERHVSDHLIGTAKILRRWGADRDTCCAGLFHTIDGTLTFPAPQVSECEHVRVRQAIGDRALMLISIFRMLDASKLIRVIETSKLKTGKNEVTLLEADAMALVMLLFANELEQASRCSCGPRHRNLLKNLLNASRHLLKDNVIEEISRVML